jgi:hypothetical protein
MATDTGMAPLEPGAGVATLGGANLERLCAHCGGPLQGRQKRFCSAAHRMERWDLEHPRINRGPEGPREGTLRQAIIGFLDSHPGEWFTVHQIAEAVRAFPHSVSARLSELRRRGQPIESDARNGDSRRAHRFRLVAR